MAKKVLKNNFEGLTKGSVTIDLDFLEKQEQRVLGDLSISLEKPVANFSFKMVNADRELIQNPNILERRKSLGMKNAGAKIENKFSEISDPIYDFDEDVDSQIKLKTTSPQKTKNIVKRVRATKNNLENRKVRY